MKTTKGIKVKESREMVVSKANFIVQKGRYKLSIAEQKTLAYIISLIPPKKNSSDSQPLEFKFKIRDYCEACGFAYGGRAYDDVKGYLQKLSDRSMWLPIDGDDILCRWLSKVKTNRGSGTVTIRFDDDMLPYLYNLKEQFTEYQLLDILPMESKYSIRLYDLLKSYANLKTWTFDADNLQELLFFEKKNFADFERKALKVAEKEINQYTTLNIRHEIAERGRYNKVTKVRFFIYTKSKNMKLVINDKNHDKLDNSKKGE